MRNPGELSLLRNSSSPGFGVLVRGPKEAAAHLTLAQDVERQRTEARQFGMRQDIADVIERQRLPLMQTDEDVALADAGLGRDALVLDGHDLEAAVELAVELAHRVDRHRGELDAELLPDDLEHGQRRPGRS